MKKTGKSKVSEAINYLKKKAPKAFRAHRDEKPEIKGGFLPSGINGGIAQFTGYEFRQIPKGRTNAGAFELLFKGVVKKPDEFQGQRVAGRPFSQTIQFVATKGGSEGGRKWEGKTVDDRVAEAQDIIKTLKGVEKLQGMDYEDMEGLLDELVEEAPHFTFRTWAMPATKANPNPRVNAQINAKTEFEDEESEDVTVSDDDEEEEEVEEETEEEETEEEVEEDSEDTEEESDEEESEEDGTEAESDDEEESEESEETEESEDDSEVDWLAEGKKADKKDKAAQVALTEKCEELGLDTEDYKTWSLTAKAIVASLAESGDSEESEEEAEEEEAEAEEEQPPKKGDMFRYKPKGAKRAMDVEVVKVDSKASKVDVKASDSGKLFKAVPWSALTPSE